MKRIADHCTIPLERGQRARWEAAARQKGAGDHQEMADWMVAVLDAAADYERAVGCSAAELLRLMVPVPLRPLLRRPGGEDGPATEIVVPTVGAGSAATMATMATMATPTAAVTVATVAPTSRSADAPAAGDGSLGGSTGTGAAADSTEGTGTKEQEGA